MKYLCKTSDIINFYKIPQIESEFDVGGSRYAQIGYTHKYAGYINASEFILGCIVIE